MPDKYKNKYRIPSSRLQNWDYRQAGRYFITICTRNRKHYFGDITNGTMQLSSVGVIADILWHEIKHHAKNVDLGAFVVMPNHIHGIIKISDAENSDATNVETGHALSLHKPIGQQRFQNIGKNSISSVVGSYKSAVTKHARRLEYEFDRQTRFYDHIIRNNESYGRISEYIMNNPRNWQNDKFYK